MPNIVTTREIDGTGHFYYAIPGEETFTEATLPAGVTCFNRRPSHIEYLHRSIIVGQFSSNLLFTEEQDLVTLGLNAPGAAPTLTATGSGVVTGICIGYIAFVHKEGSTVIAESNLTDGSASVSFTNQQRQWDWSIAGADARATHTRLYVSVNGNLPRFVADVAFPAITYTDNVATLALGAPPTLNSAGEVANNRGVPPYVRFVELYHDRAWYAGDPEEPQRVYFSEVKEPDAVGENNYIDTRGGETVTGIKRLRDTLIVFCQRATYAIQGYTTADFVIQQIHPSVGCISHFSIVTIHNHLWFAGEDGVYTYDGHFQHVMAELRDYFRDAFLANKAIYLDSIAVDDRYGQIYKLLIPQTDSPASFYYCGHYLHMAEGQPEWTFDIRTRIDSTVGELSDGLSAQVYTGSSDGWIRKENIPDDPDDDEDLYDKTMTVRHGHMLMSDPGKSIEEGKTFTRFWTYMQAETNEWNLYLLGGDEESWQGLDPDNATRFWKDTVPASESAGFIPKTVHVHIPERVSGRGLTVKLTVAAPVGVVFRGYGGEYIAGPAYRRPA